MATAAFFHDESGAVRFWVPVEDGREVGASISKETLHYRFNADLGGGAAALSAFSAHRSEIEAAVKRRLAAGSLEPVFLREADISAAPRRM